MPGPVDNGNLSCFEELAAALFAILFLASRQNPCDLPNVIAILRD
jgi:hypothetical protein